ALEVREIINLLREVVGEINLTFNRFRVAFAAHELDGHPEFQRIEASRAHLSVTEEVEFDIRTTAVFAQILRRHIKRIAQDAPAIAHECRTTCERHKHPLVRVESDRVGMLDPVKLVFVLRREGEWTTVSCVDMVPAITLTCDRGKWFERIDDAHRSGARNPDNTTRNSPCFAIPRDRVAQRVERDVESIVSRNLS